MTYHHVIAKVGAEEQFRCLFSDLSTTTLKQKFIIPYDKGTSFFSGGDLISPNELRSLLIIRTKSKEEVERVELNRISRANIEEINRSSPIMFISVGSGYDPVDIAEAGEDVTHFFIKGPPGYKSGQWTPIGWIASIVAAVVAAGVVKWLGWV
jgi:hypothetical protein